MWKRAALAAALAALLALTVGCTASDTDVGTGPSDDFVDIIVPYATTTISPDATQAPDALLIGSDGQVILNDASVLIDGLESDETPVTATVAKYEQLRLGDASAAVSNLQTRLSALGYFSGGVSGIFDEATEKAVKLFERSYGIMQTGIATAALQERLYSDAALSYGSDAYNQVVDAQYKKLEKDDVGAAVIALQTRLQELGYPIAEITGVYDDQTVKAVRKFYKMYGYKARDYAIVDLQKVLYADDAKRYDAGAATEDDATSAPETNQDYGLKLGDTGTRVTQLQLRLKELGYLTEATGTYDQTTADAVSQFEIACRLEADGIASEDLQRQLYAEDAPKAGETKQIYALLQWGDSGDAVTKLQARLKDLGYYAGEADGVFSDELVAIVKRFQSTAGLDETGVASVELQELLFSDSAPLSPAKAAEAQEDAAAAEVVITPLMTGDSGDNVAALQTRLSELGYYAGALDGKFGAGTQKAVEKFQKAVGVSQNGEASADLINLLDSDVAPASGADYGATEGKYAPLAPGDASDSVIELQRRLWELGYLVKEDIANSIGTYEDATAASVNAVMKAAGFKLRDGRASAEFQAFLFSKAAEGVKK